MLVMQVMYYLVPPVGVEPTTSFLRGKRFTLNYSGELVEAPGLKPGSEACKATILIKLNYAPNIFASSRKSQAIRFSE